MWPEQKNENGTLYIELHNVKKVMNFVCCWKHFGNVSESEDRKVQRSKEHC